MLLRSIACLLSIFLVLGGCFEKKSAQRERQYDIAANTSWSARCDAARAVESAYLEEENAAKYREWQKRVFVYCAPELKPSWE